MPPFTRRPAVSGSICVPVVLTFMFSAAGCVMVSGINAVHPLESRAVKTYSAAVNPINSPEG